MGCFGGALSCLEHYWGLLGFSYYDTESPLQTGTSPQSEGHAAGAAMNEFGTNVDVLESWKPSPIDLSRAEVNPNWKDVETETVWDNQQRSPPQPANAEEE